MNEDLCYDIYYCGNAIFLWQSCIHWFFFKTLKESNCYGLLWLMGYLLDYIVDDVRYIKSFSNKHGHAIGID